MTHFEAYRWEDHVPRKGSWKFNLVVGALAFALIAATLPDVPHERGASRSASAKLPASVNSSALHAAGRTAPAGFVGSVDEAAQCPSAVRDHADS
jgi:hypothetical protein